VAEEPRFYRQLATGNGFPGQVREWLKRVDSKAVCAVNFGPFQHFS
jgi:hypothetical protein